MYRAVALAAPMLAVSRKTRASEEPISPIPINATRSNNVSLIAPK